MPPFVLATFRATFPEFNDTVLYPDVMVNFWAGIASAQVSQCAWGTQWITGVSLYVAHELVLAQRNVKSAQAGGDPGTFGGIATTKTLGNGTVGYDATNTSEKDAGHWNLTTYGKQFYRMSRMFGAGAIQL